MDLHSIGPSFPLIISSAILLIIFFSHNLSKSSAQSSVDEAALISFKSLITNDPDQFLISWGKPSLHFCNWRGVTCGNQTRIIALELRGIDLAGSISPSLGNLTFLQKLQISETQISGSIPNEIGSLSQLQNLNLSYNLLSGSIPHTLSRCSRLISINFQSNNLTGIVPASFGALKGLESLLLRKNKLVAIEKSDWDFLAALTSCSNLLFLDLGRNALTGQLPDSVTNLSVHLQYLGFDHNQIYGGIPLGIEKLIGLKTLYLNDNLFNGIIPPLIGNLPMLELLYLGNNQFSGPIPPSFCNLSSISWLIIGTNNLEGGIPPCLGNLTSLNSLDLSQINVTGQIPSSLGNLFNLQRIALDTNHLHGNIPSSLGNLQSLLILDLGYNSLTGFIPESLWNLTSIFELGIEMNKLIGPLPKKTLPSLQILRLQGNNLQGSIPASLFNSSELASLFLDENSFDGTIHTNIGNLKSLSWIYLAINNLEARDTNEWSFMSALTNCTNLKEIDLSVNNLQGNFPHSVVNLSTTLTLLRLEGNYIYGNIPLEIGNLVGLSWLSLGPNNLTGTIPAGIGMLSSLQRLDLRGSTLSGEIPHSLGNLSMLTTLYLYDNNFSGQIPSSLGRCKQLTLMYLQNNELTGSIPKEILSITSLSLGIDLGNNLLVGPLPIEVGLLVNLVYLRVSSNKLTGEFWNNLANCVELKYLYMDNNLFQGNIASSLGGLKSLELFNVSHNNLSGKIPEFLESVKELDLSYNHFEGEVPKKGVFLNTSAFSVYGNDKLCGGVAELKLPPCIVNNNKSVSKKKHNSTMKLAIIISITFFILFLIILLSVFLTWRSKKSKKLPSLKRLGKDQNFVKVSYAELQRATNGFSSHNLIGSGSFGSVYMGNVDNIWQKIVAIKVLNLQQRGASRSFEAECRALRNVRHRNLVRILTSCSSIDHKGNDFKALVYEYMPNGNLDKWLHQQSLFDRDIKNTLTIIQRMNIIIDVASALDYLHNHGTIPIVHCDLKPSNVLLDEDMVAHVSDFGLARLLVEATTQSSQASTSSVALKGTVGYAAPEYGAANQVSVEGDMYSYGIILLEMFTGRRPTDELFNEGLNLHVFVRDALPERATDTVDPCLLLQEEDDDEQEGFQRARSIRKYELECIVSVLKIGLLCSEESPTERMQIAQALNELYAIRDVFLKSAADTRTHF